MEEPFGLKDYSDDSPVSSRDPVCGAVVVEDHAAGKTGYAGEMFYFCSAECRHRFEENPGLYIGKPRQS
jgi:Cu+-exporting ATPase